MDITDRRKKIKLEKRFTLIYKQIVFIKIKQQGLCR
jgi:hypothetical protein